MVSKEDEPVGFSPQEIARMLSREIAGEHNARLAGTEPNDADGEAWKERILDLYNQGVELLFENGHEVLLSGMLWANMNYYNRLLMFSMSEKFLESLPEDRPGVQEVLRDGFEHVAKSAHSKPLTPPSYEDYEDRLPTGFEDLFKAVFTVDEMLNRARYEGIRRMTSGLLHFGENPAIS